MKKFLFQFVVAAIAVWMGTSLYTSDQKEWFTPLNEIPNLFKLGGGVAALALSRFIPGKFVENFGGVSMPQVGVKTIHNLAKLGLVASAVALTPAVVNITKGDWNLATYVGSVAAGAISLLTMVKAKATAEDDSSYDGRSSISSKDFAVAFLSRVYRQGLGTPGTFVAKPDGIVGLFHQDQNGNAQACNVSVDVVANILRDLNRNYRC